MEDEVILIPKDKVIDQGYANVNKSGQASIHRKHAGKEIRWFLITKEQK